MPASQDTSNNLPPIEVGTHLTDYASLDLEVEGYAEGGYGLVVWGPNNANGGKMKALKLLRPDLLARANAVSAVEGLRMRSDFEREALTWCHLWPHAAIIMTIGLTRLPGWDNLPALELEYAPRGSMRQALSEAHSSTTEHLALDVALAWGQQIAAGLAVMHQPDPTCERLEPLVHCDLKPENVLLNAQGWAMLTDLGLTRAYATAPALTTTEPSLDVAVGGQASGESDAPDARDARVAKLRAALQAAGLLTNTHSSDPMAAPAFPLKSGAALELGQAAKTRPGARASGFQTRSVRVPPISAALLTTLLAPRPTAPTNPAVPSVPASPASPARVSNVTALETEPGIGSCGQALGTPPYMPPEQWWGLEAVTPASDVYALGVLLFELFTGGRWSRLQQRWLDDDLDTFSGDQAQQAQGVERRFVRFPHAPQFSVEARIFAESGMGGIEAQQAFYGAWYAAHRAGPYWRLADPAVGALTRGPLTDLARQPGQVLGVLQALSDLIADCLAPEAARRPTAVEAQRRLGEIALLAGQEPLVIPEVFPHTPEREAAFWENLAITYSHIGQHEEQLRLQRRVVALDPEDPQHWANLGAAFGELGRNEEKLAALVEAERRLTSAYTARDPQHAELLALSLTNNRGNALRHLGRYAEAIAAFRQVLAQRPDWADTRFNLALTLAQWSNEAGITSEQRLERLRAARQEAQQMLTDASAMAQGQRLFDEIDRQLARLGAGER